MNYINAWLDKHFPKKFKLRVAHWNPYSTSYKIEYAHFRFLPFYRYISRWDDRHGWYEPTYTITDARVEAIKLNSIDKINEFKFLQEVKRDSYLIRNPEVEDII